MAESVEYGCCPVCDCRMFTVVDVEPEADYPKVRLECCQCDRRWTETELKGLRIPEVPW